MVIPQILALASDPTVSSSTHHEGYESGPTTAYTLFEEEFEACTTSHTLADLDVDRQPQFFAELAPKHPNFKIKGGVFQFLLPPLIFDVDTKFEKPIPLLECGKASIELFTK